MAMIQRSGINSMVVLFFFNLTTILNSCNDSSIPIADSGTDTQASEGDESGIDESDFCVDPKTHCQNQTKDCDETNIDCGGSCGPCDLGETVLLYYNNPLPAQTEAEWLLPYLAYVDASGAVIDPYLFDGFLMMDVISLMDSYRLRHEYSLDLLFAEQVPLPPFKSTLNQEAGLHAGVADGPSNPFSQSGISVSGGPYAFQVSVMADTHEAGAEGLFGVRIYDHDGNEIKPAEDGGQAPGTIDGLSYSSYLSLWYHYLPAYSFWKTRTVSFTLPIEAKKMDVFLMKFDLPQGKLRFDRAQLVQGTAPLDFATLAKAHFNTLIGDGDFTQDPASSPWTGPATRDMGIEHFARIAGSNRSYFHQAIPVNGGQTYTLSSWIRADQADNPADPEHEAIVGIRVFDKDMNSLTSGVTGMSYSTYLKPNMWYSYADVETSWKPISATVALPATAAFLEVFLGCFSTYKTVEFDNVQLVSGSQAWNDQQLADAGYNSLIDNGGFESDGIAWHLWVITPPQGRTGVLRALDRLVGELQDGRRRSVIISIPSQYFGANSEAVDWGELYGVQLDFNNNADRLLVYIWFVEETMKRWRQLNPQHLTLKGFYWLQEDYADYVETQTISNLVHSMDLMFVGSPYTVKNRQPCLDASYFPEVMSGFDRIWIQPGVWPPGHYSITPGTFAADRVCFSCQDGLQEADFLASGFPSCLLKETEQKIDAYQQSLRSSGASTQVHVNIEWSRGADDKQDHGRVEDYLNIDKKLPHDFAKYPDHIYYEEGGFAWKCASSSDSYFRHQYDALYQFIREVRSRRGL